MGIIDDLQRKYNELDEVQRENLWIAIIGVIVIIATLYMIQRGIGAIRNFLRI